MRLMSQGTLVESPAPELSLEEWFALPEDEPGELVDGHLEEEEVTDYLHGLLVMLLGAIPLYLLKIEMIPREAAWLPSLVFVAFLAPARLLVGWAYARSGRRELPRHWAFRALGRLAILLTAPFYVLVVVLAQYTSWGGVWSLYEQHAFLLPVPFLNM